MPMSGTERKAALVNAEVTMSAIAKELGVTPSHISQVVLGKKRSPRVERRIAKAIGKPIGDVFEPESRRVAAGK